MRANKSGQNSTYQNNSYRLIFSAKEDIAAMNDDDKPKRYGPPKGTPNPTKGKKRGPMRERVKDEAAFNEAKVKYIKRKGTPGTPPVYDPDYHPLMIWSLCTEDKTDPEIAEALGISAGLLSQWKANYPEVLEAIKDGKHFTNAQVEKKLIERALGYDYKERQVTKELNLRGQLVETKVVITEKHEPANMGAIAFWLKNRRRDKWKDKWEVEHSGNVNNPAEALTDRELKALALKAMKEIEESDEND
jgi:hypothetical protein